MFHFCWNTDRRICIIEEDQIDYGCYSLINTQFQIFE